MPIVSKNPKEDIAQEIYKRNLELLKERRRAEDLLYNVSEGVFALDRDYKITIFNNALEIMLGLPGHSVLGKNIDHVIHLKNEEGVPIDIKQYCFLPPQKMPVLYNLILKSDQQDYYLNVKFSQIDSEVNPNESECLITMSDVTKEILLDKAKDDFLSLASHELRSPLTVIKSVLWLLQEELRPLGNLDANQYLDMASKSTEQMISMVNDMLNISRVEQGKLEFNIVPGKIVELVEDVVNSFIPQANEKNIYLKLDLVNCDKATEILYDEVKLKSCFLNLVNNAIKFTDKGGITVRIEKKETELKISVIDSGVGLSKDEISKLFTKFGRVENSYKKMAISGGTGLGLYAVKIFVEAMGGSVGCFSEGDYKGSTFWVVLPV